VPCAAFQPFISSLSDSYGRRNMLLVSLTMFTLGSLVGAVAQNMTTLLAGRAIQGIGGGGLLPLSIIVMSDIFPLRLRPRYMSMIQAVVALFTMLGPVVGGLCAQYASGHGGWRWVLYINFPLCAIAFPMIALNIKLYKTEGDLRSVDWVGGILFISSMLSLLIGSSWAGVEYSWASYQTLLPLILGLVGIAATLAWEQWGAENPFITISILRNRSSFAVYTCTMIQGNLVSSVPLVYAHLVVSILYPQWKFQAYPY
jgi:MFS family permease